jgi:quinol monooxygenase YgiN
MRSCRLEPGCLEFITAADLLDDGRILIAEQWQTQADLEAHVSARATIQVPAHSATPTAGYTIRYHVRSIER